MTGGTEWKTIGVLGGMGPEATAEFYKRIIGICQRDFGAKYDSDFPYIFICNLPLPDIVEGEGNREEVIAAVAGGLQKLESAGCEVIAVPCNTVFAYVSRRADVLDIIEATEDFVRSKRLKRIGLIATRNTIKDRLYEEALGNIEVVQLPKASQAEVDNIIIRILSGEKRPADKKRIQDFIKDLADSGAEAVILGCTDLPLLVSQDDSVLLIDTLQVLAEVAVKRARGAER